MSAIGVHASIFLIRVLLVLTSVLLFLLVGLVLAFRILGSFLNGLWKGR